MQSNRSNINHILSKDFNDLSSRDNEQIINELLNCYNIELSRKDRSGIFGHTQREFAYNSNKIEGSQLTKEQTASLFETGTVMSDGTTVYRAKDIEEANGHFMMFTRSIQTIQTSLCEDLIKEFHKCLKQGVFEDIANGYPIGQYKSRVNIVWDIETVSPDKVSDEMNKLIMQYHSEKIKTLSSLARFHAAYEKIHPFQDGNGRTGRIILFRECIINNIIPFIIRDTNKAKYTNVLNKAQKTNDVGDLTEYFKEEQLAYYNQLQKFLRQY